MGLTRRVPSHRLTLDGRDVTAQLAPYFHGLELVTALDEGIASQARLSLAAPVSIAANVVDGARHVLDVAIGYDGTNVAMGSYVLEGESLRGPPRGAVSRWTAASLDGDASALKVPRTRSWEPTTLGALVRAVAAEHGLGARTDPGLAVTPVQHVDQLAESDIRMLRRVAGPAGGLVLAANATLIAVGAAGGVSASGEALPPVAVRRRDVARVRVTKSTALEWTGVDARWYSRADARMNVVRAGSGDGPVWILPGTFPDAGSALAAAGARLGAMRRAAVEAEFSLLGTPALLAGSVVDVEAAKDDADGRWIVRHCVHQVSRKGYTTHASATR